MLPGVFEIHLTPKPANSGRTRTGLPDLCPICWSITGNKIRQTLAIQIGFPLDFDAPSSFAEPLLSCHESEIASIGG